MALHTSPELLSDIILNDHFGGHMIPEIVNQWLQALIPSANPPPLPPYIKGFYGCSLRPSMPIELCRGSYKHIIHETQDKAKIEKYALRMLASLDMIDLDDLELNEPTLAGLALWHRTLAEVRLEGESEGLGKTVQRFQRVRARVKLGEGKIPGTARLIKGLREVARELGNEGALEVLDTLERQAPDVSPSYRPCSAMGEA